MTKGPLALVPVWFSHGVKHLMLPGSRAKLKMGHHRFKKEAFVAMAPPVSKQPDRLVLRNCSLFLLSQLFLLGSNVPRPGSLFQQQQIIARLSLRLSPRLLDENNLIKKGKERGTWDKNASTWKKGKRKEGTRKNEGQRKDQWRLSRRLCSGLSVPPLSFSSLPAAAPRPLAGCVHDRTVSAAGRASAFFSSARFFCAFFSARSAAFVACTAGRWLSVAFSFCVFPRPPQFGRRGSGGLASVPARLAPGVASWALWPRLAQVGARRLCRSLVLWLAGSGPRQLLH